MNMNIVFAEGTNVAKVGETEYATLAEAINGAADGSTIELLNNCKLDKNVSINKDLTIKSVEGKQFTVSLESKPVYNKGAIIVEGHKLTLSNVVLDGDKLNATAILGIDGATITLGQDFIVQNVDTTKNTEPGQFDGAIRLNNMKDQERSTLDMTSNSQIIDCVARNGAACYVENSDVVMSDAASIKNCEAQYKIASDSEDQPGCGGAFRFLEDGNGQCNLIMKDSASIKNCTASFDGGAFIFDNISGTVTLSNNVVFEGNKSQRAGGAIFIPRGTLNITDNVKFENNSAERGGAIYASGMNQNNNNDAHAKLNISGGAITKNIATKYGAGVVINRYAEATLTGDPVIKDNKKATGKEGKGNFYVAADPVKESDTQLLIDIEDNSNMNVGIMGYNKNENKDYCSNAVNGQFTNRLPDYLDADEAKYNKYASKDFTGHVFNDANPDVYVEAMEMMVNEFWGKSGLYWRMNTVTYKDGCEGKAFETQVYHPGPNDDITEFDGKPSRVGYKFDGWEETKKSADDGSKAYDITRTAKWEKVNTYTVIYKDGYSETPIEKFTVNENDKTPTVDNPVRDGYVFEGWDKDIADTVTGDVTYTAKWSEKKYTVTYKDGDTVLQTSEVEKGSVTPAIEDPSKEGYKFVGWTPEVTKTVTEDATYTAKWEKLPEKFTVTYKDGYTDKPIKVYVVNENDKTPTVDNPVRDGYVFEGWDKTIADTVTGDVTYTAKWSEKKYTITYKDGDKVLQTSKVKKGLETPTIDNPSKDGYKFVGWTPEVAKTVTEDATYTAKWEKLPEKFTVTYKDGDEVLQTTEVEKDALTPTIDNPVKDGYEFVGWTPEVAKTVTEDAIYTAKWEKLPEKFTVTYKDGYTDKPIKVFTVNENTKTPTVKDPVRDGYVFEGWDKTIADTVTGDVTYTAKWSEKKYAVTYKDGDKVLQTSEVKKGSETPAIKNPVKDGYKFVGWTPEVAKTVTEDAIYTAKWEKLPEKFTVTYKDGDKVLQTTEVEKDAITPTIDNPVKDGYKFVGWTPEVAKTVTEDATYTAKWEKLPEKFTVTYKDGDNVLQTTEVEKDALTPTINNPTKDGYKFVGWTPEVAKTVTEDTTYTAKWEKLPEKFTVVYKDGDEVLKTFKDVEKDSETPTIDNPVKDGYKFVGWTPEVAKTVTEDVTYTANWEKVVVPNKEVKEPTKKNTPTTGDFGFVSGILPCALAGLGLVVWSKKH